MYTYMHILGALALAQRFNRWVASCWMDRGGRTGKPEQQNAGRTRNLYVLFFLLVDRTRSVDRVKIDPEWTENRAKIAQKSILKRPGRRRSTWGRPGTPSGRPRDSPGTAKSAPGPPQERSGEDPGPPRALWKRLGARQERLKTYRESSRDALGAHLCRRTPRRTLADRFSDDFSIKNRSFSVIVSALFFDRFFVCFATRLDRFFDRLWRHTSHARLSPNLYFCRSHQCFTTFFRRCTCSIEATSDRRNDQKSIAESMENSTNRQRNFVENSNERTNGKSIQ